ncbi:DUF6152 family protein [Polymorphobacter multimanifer]|uniref:Uncharacterized protein n=1 Tax=Polymorphobacter multimanifer TaxID=1070431 RepID=A0A841LB30_9SPHN|nr:DUF6152 family protein [Polymorphobacter multimanifer]MBB6226362.1 hypothetical protein [Polymorphobacter multimanifer]
MRRSLIALILATLPTAVLAHHGWSSYDATKPIKLTAPVTAVSWGNPHGTAKVSYQGKTWDVVLAPTSRMEARGLEKDALSKARAVTLEGYPRSDGTTEMRIERVTLGDKTIELR